MSFLIPFEFHSGDRLDDMTVVRPVARGGNGDLYLVRDDKETLLALKIIRKADNGNELRGIEQCRAVFTHIPELVPILKTGKLSDGRVYCVMPPADNIAQWPEYKPNTLADRIRQSGRIPPDEILLIIDRILSAIKALHNVGLAHCDIKPENILFIDGKPKLTDYSLLSEIAEYSGSVQNGTAGTLGFIPPEMLDNPTHYNPTSSDLYAIGKILYCAWTGNDIVSFPSVPRDIPLQEIGTIRPLYMRACNITPAKRFQNADEFISAITEARSRLNHSATALIRNNFRKNLPVLLFVLLFLLCAIGLANIFFLLKVQSGNEKTGTPQGTASGLSYVVIPDDSERPNRSIALSDPLIITTDLDIVNPNDGVTSLREAFNYAQTHGAGATLSFTGDCEVRLSAPLRVTQNIIIDGGENKITLIGPETEPMFQITESKLTLRNMTLLSDYSGDGAGILNAATSGRVVLKSVRDGGKAQLLWDLSHGFDMSMEDGTHLHRLRVNPPVTGDGSHIRIEAGTTLEDTTLKGCSGRRGGDYEVYGLLKNASITEYGDIYLFDGGVCENITVKCASFQSHEEKLGPEGGFVVHCPGGKINGIKVEYGGVYGYEKGDVLTGTVSIGGAVTAPVQADEPIIDSETDLVFDLTERTEKSCFEFWVMTNVNCWISGMESDTIIDNMKAFSGARSYTVRVREGQPPGTYRLAANAADFSSSMSLAVGDAVYTDVLSVGRSFTIGNTVYSLGLDNVKETDDSSAVILHYNVLTLMIKEKTEQ